MKFTEVLREAAGDQWERVVNHRFTKELGSGTIDRHNVLKKYLIQDHRFLDSFVILLASLVQKARCLEDRIPGCQFIALITSKENTYFERCFEALGCGSEEDRNTIPDDKCTKGFKKLMQEVARDGSLGETLAVLVVCEWSYLSWGEKVLSDCNRDDFMTYEWVDLHSGDYFESVVSYLRNLLDKEAIYIDESNEFDDNEKAELKQRITKRFLQAVDLEEQFFNNAYV